LETLGRVDDATARRPSMLPDWNVAMLVTHLARNADSHVRAAEGARLGQSRHRYPNPEARDADIDAGRDRSANELIVDLSTSIERLEAAWETLPDEAWGVIALSGTGAPEPMAELPRYRWREAEIHHVDLGLGFTVDDWDAAFVEADLELWLAGLDERLQPGESARVTATDTGRSWTIGAGEATVQVEAPSRLLLAWLIGRPTAGFPEIGPWPW
jgi:maleylpyruvate isomerase